MHTTDSIVVVLTDRIFWVSILQFLPGLPRKLLAFKRETFVSLTRRTTPKHKPRYGDPCSGGAVWLHRALLTDDTRMREMLFDLCKQRYYASMPLFSLDGVLERVCKQGTVRHLEILHDKPSLISATWPRGLLRVALTTYMDLLDDPDQREERTSTDEQLQLIRWLIQHHPEACGDRTPPRGRLLLAPEHRGFLEELLAVGVLEMTDIARTQARRIDVFLMELLLLKCPDVITPAFVQDCATAGNVGALQYVHEHTSDLPEGLFTPRLMDKATAHGHLDVVRFLHEHRTEGCTTSAMDLAASNGHLEVVQFLHEHRTEGCTPYAMESAARHGTTCGRDLAVFKYLLANRNEGLSDAVLWLDTWHDGEDGKMAFVRAQWAAMAAATMANDPVQILRVAVVQLTDAREFEKVHARHHAAAVCVSTVDPWPRRPQSLLRLAIDCGHDEIATFLVTNCAFVRQKIGRDDVYAACIARRHVNYDLVALLLAQSPDVEFTRREYEYILVQAAEKVHGPSGDECHAWRRLGGTNGTYHKKDVTNAAVFAVAPFLVETYPACISESVFEQLIYCGDTPQFYQLHASHHQHCNGKWMDSILCGERSDENVTWELLTFLHEKCAMAYLEDHTLRTVWGFGNDDTLVFMWLVWRDPKIAKCLATVERTHQLELVCRLQKLVPSLFAMLPVDLPWCCQLRYLRQRVDSGELTQTEVERARVASGHLK